MTNLRETYTLQMRGILLLLFETIQQKQVNMKDVICWFSEYWDRIETCTLARSWKNLLSVYSEDHKIENIIHEINNVLHLLQKIPGCEEAVDRYIEEWINNYDQQN